ncbi:ion channel CASTOR [Salix suchowensis]|nr:ion channel CASTOR [Salix suchowensis]
MPLESPVSEEAPAPRRNPSRLRQCPSKFQDYVAYTVRYPVSNYLDYSKLSPSHSVFLSAISNDHEPRNFTEAQSQLNDDKLMVLIYVDDLIISRNNIDSIAKLKKTLQQLFSIKDLGPLKYFLGIEMASSKKGFFLNQRKYTLDVLQDAGMLSTKASPTPVDSKLKLSFAGTALTSPKYYQQLVGKLIYLTITRPDITYAVSLVSQFMHAPTVHHFSMVKRILRYLKGTIGRGIVMTRNNHTNMMGYTDSDWAGNQLDRRSTTGYSGTIFYNYTKQIKNMKLKRKKREQKRTIAKETFFLKSVSVSKARAIVSDARALRTVLSLTGVKEGLKGHIVVELSDLDNEVLVKLVGGDLVHTVVAHDVIGRLMIQCARQPRLAQLNSALLKLLSCSINIISRHTLPDVIPCGIKVASCGGKIILNPEDSYVLQEDDEILVIAEDDDSYAPAASPTVWRGSLPKDFIVRKSAERILFCGWRRDMEDMIMVLDAFLAPGSELWMFNDVPENEREKKLIDGGLDFSRLENIQLVNREGNAVIRRQLESLPLHSFDSILILADESVEDSAIQADSRSLATLLLIRDIQSKRLPMVTQVRRGSFSQGSWIGEMQHVEKLKMVAEDQQINDVLEELFAEEVKLQEKKIRSQSKEFAVTCYFTKGVELSVLNRMESWGKLKRIKSLMIN